MLTRVTCVLVLLVGLIGSPVATAGAPVQGQSWWPTTWSPAWAWYYDQTTSGLEEIIARNPLRVIDLEIDSVSPLRVAAALEYDRPEAPVGSWWYVGLTDLEVDAKIREHDGRLIDIETYGSGSQRRFAIVLVDNRQLEGDKEWFHDLTAEELDERLAGSGMVNWLGRRVLDIEPYTESGVQKYAGVLGGQTIEYVTYASQSLQRDWIVFQDRWKLVLGATLDEVAAAMQDERDLQSSPGQGLRVADIERETGRGRLARYSAVLRREADLDDDRRIDIVRGVVSAAILDRDPITRARSWVYTDISPEVLADATRRHGARIVDLDRVDGGGRAYDAVLVDNGISLTGGPAVDALDEKIVNLIKAWGVPGAALGVVRDGRLVVARGYGKADLEAGEDARPQHRFRIASISKPITRSAVFKLVQQGRLQTDERVLDILPALVPVSVADPRIHEITVQHLLDHRSGWDNGAIGFDPMFASNHIANRTGAPRPTSLEATVRYILSSKTLASAPGAADSYSNFGYALLGLVVSARGGADYATYVADEIMEPAGITGIVAGESLLEGRHAGEVRYYANVLASDVLSVFDGRSRVPRPYGGFSMENLEAAGGLVASPIDLLRYAMEGSPRPYQGNWTFNGSLPGTQGTVSHRDGGIVVSLLMNARGRDIDAFGATVTEAVDAALGAVDRWPTQDLFADYVSLVPAW